MKSNKIEIASYIIMAIFLLSAFLLHLMSSVIAGTVVFLLIKKLYNKLSPKFKNDHAKKATLSIVIITVVLLMTGMVLGISYGIKSNQSNTQHLAEQAFNVIQESKAYIPQSLLS